MQQKIILYLRTDLLYTPLKAGGSVAHTLGVIKGFLDQNINIVCASTCMLDLLKQLPLTDLIFIKRIRGVRYMRWALTCFMHSFFMVYQLNYLFKKYEFDAIYQRYSFLNVTGVLFSWWHKKKYILEFNGSDVWIATQWGNASQKSLFLWLGAKLERFILRRADFVIVVSEPLQKQLVGWGVKQEKILVNPNGVDTQLYRPIETISVVHKGQKQWNAQL